MFDFFSRPSLSPEEKEKINTALEKLMKTIVPEVITGKQLSTILPQEVGNALFSLKSSNDFAMDTFKSQAKELATTLLQNQNNPSMQTSAIALNSLMLRSIIPPNLDDEKKKEIDIAIDDFISTFSPNWKVLMEAAMQQRASAASSAPIPSLRHD